MILLAIQTVLTQTVLTQTVLSQASVVQVSPDQALADPVGIDGLGLVASGSIVLVAVLLSVWQQLGLGRSLTLAAARAGVQLLAVGFILKYTLDPDTPLLVAFVWIGVMVAFAGWTAKRRAPEVPAMALLSALSLSSAAVIALGLLFGLGVFDFNARTIIPLGGMVVGNSISATVLVARRILDSFEEKRPQIEARLALGQTNEAASAPYLRSALQTALLPQIETTKAVGIVFLPGAMVGLILGGADPQTAVAVQVTVMYMVLGSVAISTTVLGLGLRRRLFSTDGRLISLASEGVDVGDSLA
jgi:putative ABC transport system permease protein